MKKPLYHNSRHGFTMLELLAVMSIVIMMMAWVTPSLSSMVMGTNLNRAGTILADNLMLARQEAVSMNRDIQVRFFEDNEGGKAVVRGIQLWRVEENREGQVMKAITRVVWFPQEVAVNMNETFSPLLASAGIMGEVDVAGRKMAYRGFRIRANGSLDSSADQSFITIQSLNDSTERPKNFYTIKINPLTARLMVFRP